MSTGRFIMMVPTVGDRQGTEGYQGDAHTISHSEEVGASAYGDAAFLRRRTANPAPGCGRPRRRSLACCASSVWPTNACIAGSSSNATPHRNLLQGSGAYDLGALPGGSGTVGSPGA